METLQSSFDWMLSGGWRASLLALVILLAQLWIGKRLAPRLRYGLWLPVVVVLIVPTIPFLPAPVYSGMADPEAQPTVRDQPIVPEVTVVPSMPLTPALPEIPPVPMDPGENTFSVGTEPVIFGETGEAKPLLSDTITRNEGGESKVTIGWPPILIYGWLSGFLLMVVLVIGSMAYTMRRIRRNSLPVDPKLQSRISKLSQEMGLRQSPRVIVSPRVSSPAVGGLLRPVMLINDGFLDQVTSEEADLVLRHELAHIRRGDLWMNALLCGLLAIHWFNPILWIAFFRSRADLEAVCDDYVLRGEPTARRVAYGHALLKLETSCSPLPRLCFGFVGIFRGKKNELRSRIESIVNEKKSTWLMKAGILLSVLTLSGIGLARAADPSETPEPQVPEGELDSPTAIGIEDERDLRMIDRRIAKEPKYETDQQQYCLLLVGPGKPKQVWVVRDGRSVFIDCNGNGDLTEPGERFPANPDPKLDSMRVCLVECGAVSREYFHDFHVWSDHSYENKWDVSADRKVGEFWYDSGDIVISHNAATAPVVRVACGVSVVPLIGNKFWHHHRNPDFLEPGHTYHLYIWPGEMGLGEGTGVRCGADSSPKYYKGTPIETLMKTPIEMRSHFQRSDGTSGSELQVLPFTDDYDP